MITQSYTIAHGGRYELGRHIGRIGKVRLVSITVNGKLIRYSDLNHRESGCASRYYVEVGRSLTPCDGGMVMVNKDEGVIETFVSSDRFHDSVVVTLDIYAEGES
jgi:hypothetical protein